MFRRMIFQVSFVFVLALVLTNFAQAELIGYWKNDESSGIIAADSAGGDNDGILFGDQLEWTAGRFGGALSHGGLWDAGVEFLTTGMSATAGTVAMWGLLADPQPAHTKYFFGHTTQRQWTNRVQLYMDEGDNLLDIGLGNSHTLDTDILELPMEQWLHVALTWDSGRYVVYVDGEEVSSGAYGGLSAIYPIANIGNDGSSWPYEGFAGLLDEVRLYDHALNADNILYLFYPEPIECLIAHWKLDEIEGAMAYDSVGDNDGILYGNPIWQPMGGMLGGALEFDGDNDYVDCGTFNPSDATGQLSICLWAKWNGLNGRYQGLIGKRNSWNVNNMMWQLETSHISGDVMFEREGYAGVAGGILTEGDWEHWCVTFDGATAIIYRMGEEVNRGAFSFGFKTDAQVVLGGSNTANPFNGALDDVRIYDCALNAAEILAAMEGVSAPGGADIILVTEAIDWDMDGLRDDHSLESFLVSEGHSVDVRPDYWKELTPDKIAELNMADLVIFSRLAWSSRYNDGDETTQWNSLTTPLLQMSPYFARNTHWRWANAGVNERTPHIYAEAVDPHHPIFRGVLLTALDPSDPDYPANVVQMIDPLVGTGHTSFIDTTNMGNGHLIAKPVQAGMGWIAEWDVGVEFYEGAGQYSGGRRMLFCAGTQEIQFLDPDTQEVMTTAQGELNLTAEGLQMFRNAIDYLLKPEFTGSVGIVEDFETNDFSQFPWNSYGDESWEATRSERHSGYYSARSGSIEDGEETSLEVSIDCVWGYITFYCKVSSESGFDKLTFYIDGLEQGKWSGQEDWAEVYFHVREGTRTFKWAYSKDSSISEGDDTVWIDDIVFPIGP